MSKVTDSSLVKNKLKHLRYNKEYDFSVLRDIAPAESVRKAIQRNPNIRKINKNKFYRIKPNERDIEALLTTEVNNAVLKKDLKKIKDLSIDFGYFRVQSRINEYFSNYHSSSRYDREPYYKKIVKELKISEELENGYFSGKVSLNLNISKTSGDWHSLIAEREIENSTTKVPLSVIGAKYIFDTTRYFKADELISCRTLIRKMNLKNPRKTTLVATHSRAVADMLLWAFINDRSTNFIEFENWLPSQEDQLKVFKIFYNNKNYIPINLYSKFNSWKQAYVH